MRRGFCPMFPECTAPRHPWNSCPACIPCGRREASFTGRGSSTTWTGWLRGCLRSLPRTIPQSTTRWSISRWGKVPITSSTGPIIWPVWRRRSPSPGRFSTGSRPSLPAAVRFLRRLRWPKRICRPERHWTGSEDLPFTVESYPPRSREGKGRCPSGW